jgi:hypothetical protein
MMEEHCPSEDVNTFASPTNEETETELVADWLAASARVLHELWGNEEDAVYDDR